MYRLPPTWVTASLRLGLAGVHQCLQQPALDVVGDRLALEVPDGDRVGAGVGRG
jgi:hypothetical protein